MQRSGAAKAHQGEVARVIALLNGDQPQRAEHIFVHNVDDAGGGVHQIDAQRIGYRLDRFGRALPVQLETAAEQRFGQIAEHDIGVGYSRLFAAFAIGDRSGLGAGAFRANAQRFGQFGNESD